MCGQEASKMRWPKPQLDCCDTEAEEEEEEEEEEETGEEYQ